MVEDDGTLEVCARIIPVNGTTVPLDPPQGPGGAQSQVLIGLDAFFAPLQPPTISANLFTVESPPGPLTAIGDNILIVLLCDILVIKLHACRWITSGS